MTTGRVHGEQWSGRTRDWARFTEPHYRPLYETVFDRLGIETGTKLLDVGCGPGGAAALAAERGAHVAGLDAAPGAIEVARDRVPAGDFRVGDMETLPWPGKSFDAVTGFNSFQFAGNPATALSEARRVRSRGGRIGMAIWKPPQESQQPRIMAAISALAPAPPPSAPGPFALSAPGTLESVLEEAGLQPVESGELSVVLDYPDAEAVCRSMMAGSAGTRAIKHVGEEAVRQAILERLEEFRSGEGYTFVNHFRFVIAK
jgi:SAM-dependent methyltransferase